MKKRNGFSLIELLMYCALTALVLMMLMHWIVGVVSSSNKNSLCCEEYIMLATAMNSLRSDLMRARSVPQKTVIEATDWYIWSLGSKDVGWFVEKNNLMRAEGDFDAALLRWKAKTVNLVAPSIKNFLMQSVFHKKSPYCEYSLDGKLAKKMSKIVALRADGIA